MARWQSDHVAAALRQAHPGLTVEIVVLSTRGDRVLDTPLPEIGGKGLFTEELEAALREGRIDVAVHSLKDLPTAESAGLVVGAIPARADARDALVSRGNVGLGELPAGAVVGTSSLRRIAQLRRLRPDVTVKDVRGNVDTRVRKVLEAGEYDAILLACAGLDRLGLSGVIGERLSPEVMVPAPGQAALGIQCRDEPGSLALVAPLNDGVTAREVTAERAFLAGLGGGCAVPVAAYARAVGPGGERLRIAGRVTSARGEPRQVDVTLEVAAADVRSAREAGVQLASLALARGAAEVLAG